MRSRRARPRTSGESARPAEPTPSRCDNCGARQTVAGAKHCAFCGVVLREPPPAPAGPFGDVDARFAALRAHAGLDRALTERPPAMAGAWPGLTFAGVGAVFVGMAFFMWRRARAMQAEFDASWRGFGGPERHSFPDVFDSVLPLFMAVGAAVCAYGIYRLLRFRNAPWESYPALVVDERTEVTGGGNDSQARTAYYVTLENEVGRRRELRTTGNMAGGVRPGDLGVAHIRDGMLLGFRRLHERAHGPR